MPGQHTVVDLQNISKVFVLHRERPRSFQDLFVRPPWRNNEREEFWALKNINLQAKAGETVGVIGPNGAGKSTLLKLIARILRPTTGTIRVGGKVAGLLELGAGFHPELTGRENIYLNGSILGFTKKHMDAKLEKIVAFSELEHFLDIPVKHYSSGMYLRLGFAIASHVEADIILADEVIAVGDESFQRKCLQKINSLQQAGRSIILVSHDLRAVGELCQRVVWLKDGTVAAEGSPSKVIEEYLAELAVQRNNHPGPAPLAKNQELSPHSSRWGSGEAEIVSVKLLHGGEERYVFRTGESITIQLEYVAPQKIANPVFGVGIRSNDGTLIFGTNTQVDRFPIPPIEGRGVIEITFEAIPLLQGTYLLDAAIVDHNGHDYDYRKGVCPFIVSSEGREAGHLRLQHEWHIGSIKDQT